MHHHTHHHHQDQDQDESEYQELHQVQFPVEIPGPILLKFAAQDQIRGCKDGTVLQLLI